MTQSPTTTTTTTTTDRRQQRPRNALRHIRVAVVCAVALTLAPAANGPVADARANRTVFKSAGAEATVVFADGMLQAVVFVARGGPAGSPETFLTYQILDRGTGLPINEGQGVIPNSAFTATAASAHLLIDTRTLPDFTYSTGSGGVLNITWTGTDFFQMTSLGATVITTPGTKMTILGQRTLTTAAAVGTCFGDVVAGTSEVSIGTNKETTITIERAVP